MTSKTGLVRLRLLRFEEVGVHCCDGSTVATDKDDGGQGCEQVTRVAGSDRYVARAALDHSEASQRSWSPSRRRHWQTKSTRPVWQLKSRRPGNQVHTIPVAIKASVEIVRTVESKHSIYNELSSTAGTVWFDAPYGLLVATTGHVSKQQQ